MLRRINQVQKLTGVSIAPEISRALAGSRFTRTRSIKPATILIPTCSVIQIPPMIAILKPLSAVAAPVMISVQYAASSKRLMKITLINMDWLQQALRQILNYSAKF